MERGSGGGSGGHHHQQQHHQQQQQHHHQQQQHHPQQHLYQQHPGGGYMHPDDAPTGQSSLDNPATKKKPPKLRAINRSISMAIDNYAPQTLLYDDDGGIEETLIVEQPLIHRAPSPLPARASAPPQTLALPTHHQMHAVGAGAVSPALSGRQRLQTFQQLAAQAGVAQRHQQKQHHQQQQHHQPHQQYQHHASAASSPTAHSLSPVAGGISSAPLQPDIYLLSSNSLGDGNGVGVGGSTSPIQFIDDYLLPPTQRHVVAGVNATHPLKKSMFRRSDTIDVHGGSNFQMKKTHSFHAQQDHATLDQLLLSAAATNIAGGGGSSASSSRRTSSVRGNFLMPSSGPQGVKDVSRSPSPSRRGCRSHRSFNDPARRPSSSITKDSAELRHPSLNDELLESLDAGRAPLYSQAQLSLENELFVESRSRSNSHTKLSEAVEASVVPVRMASAAAMAAGVMRKSSGSFDEPAIIAAAPIASSSSLKKREHPRQHSSHSLELDGRASGAHPPHTLQLHSAAAAATAAYHFKRGAKHGHSLYLSPNNLEELQVHRPGVIAAAAAFQGTNASASAKQAKALHSASMRLRTYRETLSASKKSKSFIGDSAYPPPAPNEFELTLTSPHRRNSRPLTSGDDIKRSPRPIAIASTSAAAAAATAAFIEEKRPSFERKSSLTYELGDAAFEQVLRPFHHKAGSGRKGSMTGSHKALKKKSLSDETDEDEEADRKRKRIVCIVMTVFLCLMCASVFVVIITLTHSSGQSQHTSKKIYTFTRETPVHYNVRQENERLMKESLDRARFAKNFTDAAAMISAPLTSTLAEQIP